MRYYICLLFWGIFAVGYSQVQTPAVSNSAEPASINEKENEPINRIDSTSIEISPVSTRSKTFFQEVKQEKRGYNDDSSLEVETESVGNLKADLQTFSTNFQFYKTEATVQRTQRSPNEQQQMEMNKVVDFFEKNAPNSFEYHYFKYVAGNYNTELKNHLDSAEALRPNNSDVHVQMAAYYMIKNDYDKAKKYLEKLKENKRLSKTVIDYGIDVLISVPKNGTLITHGFDDSFGVYVAQNELGIRKDVTLVSLDFLQSEAYRNRLIERGYLLPNRSVVDVNYFVELCRLNEEKMLNVSMTTPKEYLIPLQKNLFVVGLTFEYHKDAYNNFSRNDELWYDSLQKDVINDVGNDKSRLLSSNYLPMLLQLRKVYLQRGENEKAQEVDDISDKIAVQCNKYEQVQKLKNGSDN